MKVSIIIAVYNEALTVAALLERVWAQPLAGAVKEIIIVESNSTDGSRDIVAEFAVRRAADLSSTVRVIYEQGPKGKGHAVRHAFAA
ncbi:MAG TPA: glycosyltransferase, partial [Steroidobacteraceae bacterium]|nr:glycosyltransferase [Steroidobacteraceae bacterium]